MRALFLSIISLTGWATAFEGTPPNQPVESPEKHWAFKMPVAPDAGIDELVDRKITKSGLKKSPPASREELIRRTTHAITGLEPTTDEIARWSKDARPDWLDLFTNDLLARPTFGERWARHWLDVARYADTKGAATTENEEYPYAYTYRDWVINALNRDLPYDQFIHRQIAADLMELPREELAALGFLTVGRSYQGGRRELVIADQIDVSTRGVMGLTVACARCHDHKDDPIPTADFYALYGVFDSAVEPQKLPLIAEPDQSEGAQAFFKEREKLAHAVHDFVKSVVPEHTDPRDILDFNLPPPINNKLNQTERNRFRNLTSAVTSLEASSPYNPPRAMVVRERPKPIAPVIFERGNPGARGEKIPRAFLTIFREKDEVFQQGSGRLEFAHRLTDDRNPLTARVWVNRVWMHLTGIPLVESPGDFGVQTREPVQRDLLDHLALFLQKNGWSTKALIRHIVSSRTFQRSSLGSTSIDPENHYLARGNRVRKDLEAWRDSALQISGRLDPTLGGKPFIFDKAPFLPRRTIYGQVRRGFLPSILRAFDFPGSEEALMMRTATTTPTQALYLMNSPFLHQEARAIAANYPSIQEIYQAVLKRAPSPDELAAATPWIANARQTRTTGMWDYGYVANDSTDFKPLPRFAENRWLGNSDLPDPELGWLHWNAHGGHPELDKAAALQWTAIESGTIHITGNFKATGGQGNGVRGRIMRPTGEVLGEWILDPPMDLSTAVSDLKIQAGDSLLFIVDSRDDQAFDGFTWAPKISDERGLISDAAGDFAGPGLEPLAQLAQVLLLSNEFFFVD
ncbi:DUF1549 and DUF1553 domain-containing protein [Verrucomicrobiaceae bacterium 227]